MKHVLSCAAFFLLVASCDAPARARTGAAAQETQQGQSAQAEAKPVLKKAVIKSRPAPDYTEEARKNRVEGTVVLKMVLASSRKVTNIKVVEGLPDGLTESAIEAARRITFEPATKDGRPISQWVTIKYNFHF